MKTIQSETEIDASPSRVWAILSDFASYPDWNPFMKRIQGDARPGGRLEVHIEPPGFRGMTLRPTVLAAIPDKELRWLGHLLLPRLFDGEHQLLLSSLGDRRSRFTQREVFRGVLVPFTGGILAKTEKGFAAMNEALKKRAEESAQGRSEAAVVTPIVRDARPPAALIRVLNPIMRVLLPSRLGRWVRSFALVEFSGRRSGNGYRVPVVLNSADGVSVVFTPAAWRANFRGGAPATLHHRGRTHQVIGTLVTDPAEVAAALRSVLAGGTSPLLLGLDIASEHIVSPSDIASVGREMISFHPDNPSPTRLPTRS